MILVHEASGVVRKLETNGTGAFLFAALRSCAYTIEMEAQSFRGRRRTGVPLSVVQRTRVDDTVEAGDVSESITVTGEASPFIETEPGRITLSYGERQFQLAVKVQCYRRAPMRARG